MCSKQKHVKQYVKGEERKQINYLFVRCSIINQEGGEGFCFCSIFNFWDGIEFERHLIKSRWSFNTSLDRGNIKKEHWFWILPSFFTLLATTHSTSHSIALQEHCLDIIIITIITSSSLNNNNKINRCVSVFRSPLISIVTGFSQLLYRMRKDRSIFSASLCRVSFFSVLSTAWMNDDI